MWTKNQNKPVSLFVEGTEKNEVLQSSSTEHETKQKNGIFFYLKAGILNKIPGSQWEVTLEEQGLHCVEEDHHKLHQLGKNLVFP